jgi:hypothetical protein
VRVPVSSLYVDAAAQPWTERRPRVFWKVLWEEGEHKAMLVRYAVRRPPGCVHTVHSDDGALVLAILSGGTQPLPAEGTPRGEFTSC